MPVEHLIPILQVSIGPVILISGIGLLILSMTNRFARIVDRSRQLTRELRACSDSADERSLQAQLSILIRRARLVRIAIFLAAISVLLAAVLIILLFLTALLGIDSAALITTLFIICMASLIVSLLIFLKDINLSLSAFTLEVSSAVPDRDASS
ncbi:MAG TPA: DUF2721 domain-containing protein [Bacteroidota bacterium]|nr:DUF2721 domain-containing protein [Bacteroidota bacterium]